MLGETLFPKKRMGLSGVHDNTILKLVAALGSSVSFSILTVSTGLCPFITRSIAVHTR